MEANLANDPKRFHYVDQADAHQQTVIADDFETNFMRMDFFDFGSEFSDDTPGNLTGMNYINYLRLHDDMI